MRTTNTHTKYWRERKIDWKTQYLDTWDHPHRQLIVCVLQAFQNEWMSVWEVGCGPGPNLARIFKEFHGKQMQLGGSDLNEDAIKLARATFQTEVKQPDGTMKRQDAGMFHVESSEDMLLSDKAVDVMLSDAHLIYIGPFKIRKVLKEMVRITRNRLVLCEYEEKSWWKRIQLWWKTGYFAHDYKKLLEEAGCFDVQMAPIPEQFWGGNWSKYGKIITAKIAHI